MTKKGSNKPTKAKQLQIAGTERKTIAAIDRAAEEYRTARDQRMALTEDETKAHADLIDVMKANGIKHGEKYVYVDDEGDELEVIVDDVVKVKVRKVKQAKAKSDE